MDLLRRANKPETIAAIAKDAQASERYALFLLSKGDVIPQPILDALSGNSSLSSTIAIKLKQRGKEVPESMISAISQDPSASLKYTISIFGVDKEVEPEILNSVVNNNRALSSYIQEVVNRNPNLPVSHEMLKKLEETSNFPVVCLHLAKAFIKHGKKNYKELDPLIINAICASANVAENFAHFIQPYFGGKIPPRIKKAIGEDASKVKMGWSKGGSDDDGESFAKWFREKNPDQR
jgi:hypothetical protein